MVTFWATLGKLGLFRIPSSAHTVANHPLGLIYTSDFGVIKRTKLFRVLNADYFCFSQLLIFNFIF